jgi:hypothetical protein
MVQFIEGWTTNMKIVKNVLNPIISPIFFLSTILVCTYFMSNLYVAIFFKQFQHNHVPNTKETPTKSD